MFKKYQNLSKISKYYKKDKNLNYKLLTVMFSGSFLGMLLPYAYSQRMVGMTEVNFRNVVIYASVIVFIITFHHTFWYLWSRFAGVVKNKVAADIRGDIMEKMLDTKYSEVKNKTTGFYIERIYDDVMEVAAFWPDVLGIVIDCVTNFSFVILMFFISFKCALIFVISVLFCYGISLVRINQDLKYTEKLKVLNEVYNTKINENVKGLKDIKGLGIKGKVLESTNAISQEIARLDTRKVAITMLLTRIETYSHYVAEAILVIYAVGVLIPKGELTVVELLLIINYSGFMYELIGWIAKFKEYFEKGDFKAGRLLEILDSENVDKFGEDDVEMSHFGITVKDLSYAFDDNQEVSVLDRVTFSVEEHSANVFLGLSGSGKSTLFNLLTKILMVENGKIFVGNVDINAIPEKELRETICIIHQEPFLLNDTIMNNIKIVKPEATAEEVYLAAQMANIYDEIKAFKDGFETMVYEGGNNLSGGQKQRIAIARALLKDSKILLFDEPTSALDKENQELFYNIIRSLKKDKTILVIAHKYGDLNMFDNVFELENGVLHKKN